MRFFLAAYTKGMRRGTIEPVCSLGILGCNRRSRDPMQGPQTSSPRFTYRENHLVLLTKIFLHFFVRVV